MKDTERRGQMRQDEMGQVTQDKTQGQDKEQRTM